MMSSETPGSAAPPDDVQHQRARTGEIDVDETRGWLLWSSIAITLLVWLGANLESVAAMLLLTAFAQGAPASRAFRLELLPPAGAALIVLAAAHLGALYDHQYASCGAPTGASGTTIALAAIGLGIVGGTVALVVAIRRSALASRVVGFAVAIVGAVTTLLALSNALTDWCGS